MASGVPLTFWPLDSLTPPRIRLWRGRSVLFLSFLVSSNHTSPFFYPIFPPLSPAYAYIGKDEPLRHFISSGVLNFPPFFLDGPHLQRCQTIPLFLPGVHYSFIPAQQVRSDVQVSYLFPIGCQFFSPTSSLPFTPPPPTKAPRVSAKSDFLQFALPLFFIPFPSFPG